MRCPSCAHDVPDGNKFCGNCGAVLASTQAQERPEPDTPDRDEPSPGEREPTPTHEGADEEPPLQVLAPTDTTDEKGEREVWKGRYSNWNVIPGLVLAILVGLVLVLLARPILFQVSTRSIRIVSWIAVAICFLLVFDVPACWVLRRLGLLRGRSGIVKIAAPLALAAVFGAILLALAGLASKWLSISYARFAPWALVVVSVAAILLDVIWGWAKERYTLRYRLTTERLFQVKGFLKRTVDEAEIVLIDDVQVDQSFIDRILRVGDVRVLMEMSEGVLDAGPEGAPPDTAMAQGGRGAHIITLKGILEPNAVKEKIRNFARERKRRTLHIEGL